MRTLGILSALFAATVCALQPTYMLHYDPGAVDAKARSLFVDDGEVATKIPGFAHVGPRINSCYQSMTMPPFLVIEYAPTVLGPHSARTNVLKCKIANDSKHFACSVAMHQSSVIFGDTPSKYFALGPGTPVDQAIEVFNAYNNGSIHFNEGSNPRIKDLRISKIERKGSAFVLQRSDCGCSNPIKVELKHENGEPIVTAIADLGGMCI